VVVHRKSARLGNLVALRQVRVEVVLTGPHGVQVDFAVERKPKADGVFHGLLVRNGHGARHAEADGAHVLVRGRIHFDFAAAEHLRLRRELTMDFKTDNRTVVGHINSVILRGKDSFLDERRETKDERMLVYFVILNFVYCWLQFSKAMARFLSYSINVSGQCLLRLKPLLHLTLFKALLNLA